MGDIKLECCKCKLKLMESDQLKTPSKQYKDSPVDVSDMVCPRCKNDGFYQLPDDTKIPPLDPWGGTTLDEAREQLKLSDDYVIFFMASEIQQLSDEFSTEIEERQNNYGSMYAEDVEEVLKKNVNNISLPPGFRVVGLTSVHGDKFGLVDYRKQGAA